jgi:hypothetical protein
VAVASGPEPIVAPSGALLRPPIDTLAVLDPCTATLLDTRHWRTFQFTTVPMRVRVPSNLRLKRWPSPQSEEWFDERSGLRISVRQAGWVATYEPPRRDTTLGVIFGGDDFRTCAAPVAGQQTSLTVGQSRGYEHDYYATVSLRDGDNVMLFVALHPVGSTQPLLLTIAHSAEWSPK